MTRAGLIRFTDGPCIEAKRRCTMRARSVDHPKQHLTLHHCSVLHILHLDPQPVHARGYLLQIDLKVGEVILALTVVSARPRESADRLSNLLEIRLRFGST